MADRKDERIGIIGSKKATLNILGKPFRPPALMRLNISADQYVVLDNVPMTSDIEGALKDIGVAAHVIKDVLNAQPENPAASPPIVVDTVLPVVTEAPEVVKTVVTKADIAATPPKAGDNG